METKQMTDYEKRVLAATPGKALTFLRTAATKVEIRAALFAAGYSSEEQEVGWNLLQQASGYVPGLASVSDDGRVRAAIAAIDAWDEPGFRRIDAALLRLHPEQHEFVFAGLESVGGVGSVLSVQTLLDRLDELDSAAERAASRAADRAAIETLTARGITPEVRQQLRQLIQIAQTAVPPVFTSDPSVETREKALLELRSWYRDWSESARAVIQRKDYLVMLGLSKRRVRQDGTVDAEETEPVAETEVPVDSSGDQVVEPSVAPPTDNGATIIQEAAVQ